MTIYVSKDEFALLKKDIKDGKLQGYGEVGKEIVVRDKEGMVVSAICSNGKKLDTGYITIGKEFSVWIMKTDGIFYRFKKKELEKEFGDVDKNIWERLRIESVKGCYEMVNSTKKIKPLTYNNECQFMVKVGKLFNFKDENKFKLLQMIYGYGLTQEIVNDKKFKNHVKKTKDYCTYKSYKK